MSKAHSQYLVVKNFYEALKHGDIASKVDATSQDVLWKLFRLWSLHTLEQEGSEFFASGAASRHQISLARTNSVMKLLKEIRPHAVRLVDSWGFDDFVLDSSLGRFDGKVYEDMFYRASELNPLNGVTVDPYPESEVLFKKVEPLAKAKL